MPATEAAKGVALVTGGARRIGRVISLALARAGYSVAIHCHDSGREADEAAGEVVAAGGRAAVVRADMAALDADGLVAAAAQALGTVTVLVNNASIFESDAFGHVTAAALERHYRINLEAPVLLAQAFAAKLPPELPGCIVNLIDHRVLKPTPQHFSYTLAKAALHTATRTMAQALAPRIRVNGVGPGPVLPNGHDGADGLAREAAGVLLQHRVPPEEIAEAVLYLVEARSVTGQMIAVDAGQSIGWRTPDVLG